ncbi:MAG: hypothetical protein EBS01_16695, partial [Verrucomicrobia bacterium]|nr:hypothetical protein [Verrucomicrobiota bacterium]
CGRLAAAAAVLESMPGSTVNEYDACRALAALGIAPAQSEVITDPAQKTSVGFPAVAKILSPDILHKTDAGGVFLNLGTASEVRSAYQRIADNIAGRTICAFGEACSWPTQSFLAKFPDEFEKRVV